ncbi:MAG: PAS domain-containing protein, partial [Aestuariivirga sp.]
MNGTRLKDAEMVVNQPYETNQAESQILHPGSRALFSFWETMRAENAAPLRGALDLKRIGDLVPNLMIIEPGPRPGGFRWRLAGTAVCGLYQRELTGTNGLLGWDNFEAHVVGRFLTGVVKGLQPCLLRFRLHTDLHQMVGA